MVVIGALGLATDVLQILIDLKSYENLYFYDDVMGNSESYFFGKHPIIRTSEELKSVFQEDNRYIIAVGDPHIRKELYLKIKNLGGEPTPCISPYSKISDLKTSIDSGACITSDVVIAGNVKIGICCLIYHFSFIAHDSRIGDFVQIAAGTKIMGRCQIGDLVMIGPNVTINPGVRIGSNTTVGAGSVVTKDLPDNCIAYGVPAKVIRYKE